MVCKIFLSTLQPRTHCSPLYKIITPQPPCCLNCVAIAEMTPIPLPPMAGTVVLFDFDHTIVDCESEVSVIDGLGATQTFNDILRTNPWNSAMDKIMRVLESQQPLLIQRIVEQLHKVPIHPATIAAIKSAHALGCDLRIVSDANVFFIETILKHHGLLDCFTEINANPNCIDEDGRLRITPYHDATKSPPHGCALCPPNMCKALVLERIRASAAGGKRIVYMGDGENDYCPSMRLTEADYLLPRRDYRLWELIHSNDKAAVKAEVHGWSYGEEQGKVLLEIIDDKAETVVGEEQGKVLLEIIDDNKGETAVGEEQGKVLLEIIDDKAEIVVDAKPASEEWRFKNGMLSSQEALPVPLRVRH